MSFEFELHGEFENTLGYDTGAQMGPIDEKKPEVENLTLKAL
jgi:hypothetical protein